MFPVPACAVLVNSVPLVSFQLWYTVLQNERIIERSPAQPAPALHVHHLLHT